MRKAIGREFPLALALSDSGTYLSLERRCVPKESS